MSSPSYDAAVAFLVADVLSTIETEQPGLLAAGSVTVCRAPRGSWPRRSNPPAVSVEIVARGETPVKAVGIGMDEVGQVFDLMCCVRRLSTAPGTSQLDTVEDMARALFHRYRLASELTVGATVPAQFFGPYFPRPFFSVPYYGPTTEWANFLRSDAKRIEIDAEPGVGGRIRAVTRVTFNFLEPRA